MGAADEVIAHQKLFGQRADEKRFPITVEVGRPFPWGGSSPTEWACNVKVDPFYSHTVHGEGSLQALCLALQCVRSQLNHFKEEGGVLLWDDGQEWSPESYWPLMPY